jgi:hypothetical protein
MNSDTELEDEDKEDAAVACITRFDGESNKAADEADADAAAVEDADSNSGEEGRKVTVGAGGVGGYE